MASLATHQSAATTKLLFIGNSGAGKTGALASLASAGYKLRIIDLDNGLDVLANLLGDATSTYDKGAIERVKFVTLTEKMKMLNGIVMPVAATVWSKMTNLLSDWKDGEEKLGPVTTWTSDDVLVIDSLSFLGTAAMNFILQVNGRLGKAPFQSDWGEAQRLLESLLQMLYSTDVKCNVIVCCHIVFLGKEGEQEKGFPNALGKALPPKIGRYFNSTLMAETKGQGSAARRVIVTNTSSMVELKNTAPLKVKPEYPLTTGLADYFFALHGKHPTK